MSNRPKALSLAVGFLSIGASVYLAYVAKTWLSYGSLRKPASDDLLDRYMPEFDVREHHRVRVAAPAEMALLAACEMDMSESRMANALFKGRQLIMRGHGPDKDLRGCMVEIMQSLGWVILDVNPGCEVALGTGAQPWLADGDFRSIPADEFQAFHEPHYVKIVLSLKAEPISTSQCYLSTETRAIATDEFARKRFRVYWAFLSPGIRLLRWPMMTRARNTAERKVKAGEIAA